VTCLTSVEYIVLDGTVYSIVGSPRVEVN
jgi:hypothetical protein